MKPKFQITKENNKRYIIKKKEYLLFPFTYMKVMSKAEFIPDLNEYGYSVLVEEWATFKSIKDSFDALSVWSSIKGIEEIIVKVVDRYEL
jgi:hypothetical protein